MSLLHSLGSKVAIFWGRKKHIFLIISNRTEAGYDALISPLRENNLPHILDFRIDKTRPAESKPRRHPRTTQTSFMATSGDFNSAYSPSASFLYRVVLNASDPGRTAQILSLPVFFVADLGAAPDEDYQPFECELTEAGIEALSSPIANACQKKKA